mgnify:CR=1 FL=1
MGHIGNHDLECSSVVETPNESSESLLVLFLKIRRVHAEYTIGQPNLHVLIGCIDSFHWIEKIKWEGRIRKSSIPSNHSRSA